MKKDTNIFSEFRTKVEALYNNINSIQLRSKLILYRRELDKLYSYVDYNNTYLMNRLINDQIFTELVFDRVLDCLKNNDVNRAVYYLGKEITRFRVTEPFIKKGIYFENEVARDDTYVITQDVALKTLTKYETDYLKRIGFRVGKDFNYDDLDLSETDYLKISFLVKYPILLEQEKEVFRK